MFKCRITYKQILFSIIDKGVCISFAFSIFLKGHFKIQENAYKSHSDQHKLKSKGYSAYIGDGFNNSYTFGFMSPWQKNLLLNLPYFYLDVTHKTTNVDRCLLYTFVVRHSFTGTDCPLTFVLQRVILQDLLLNFYLL